MRLKENKYTAFNECNFDKVLRFVSGINCQFTSRDVTNITGINIKLVSWALGKIAETGIIFKTGKGKGTGSGYLFRRVTSEFKPVDINKHFNDFCFKGDL